MGVTHGGARRGFRSAFPARYGVSLPAPGAQGSDRALGRGQIVVSLHTEVRTLALRRARALLLATGDLFSDLRQMTKPNKPKTYSTNYEYGIEWDPTTGALKSVRFSDAKPEDQPAIDRHIQALREESTARVRPAPQSTSTPSIVEASTAVR